MIIYFADSCHVGTVCLLSNRKPDTKARIDVDLEDYYRIKDAKDQIRELRVATIGLGVGCKFIADPRLWRSAKS